MSFTSLAYAAFFSVVLIVLSRTRSARAKRGFLLAASYLFYAWWDWRFVFLLAGMTVLNHLGARWIDAAEGRSRKSRMLAIVGADLLILGVFKYAGFFVDSANRMLHLLDLTVPAVGIVLPIAISFITFEVISYTVDVYRRDLKAVKLFDLALLVAFFPHLVAGPILKPRLFLPQVSEVRDINRGDLDAGARQFVVGLLKKVLIADRLAAFVDPVMTQPDIFASATLWLAVFAYSVQIYMDFSGYSDMAIGSARMMGFDIPPNFSMPYASRTITEFWRRWHISLSTWLREYLYIPLGGNRKGKVRQAINLVVLMLLAGLWHGASWNFVLWGGLHGLALAVHKVWMDVRARTSAGASEDSGAAWGLADFAAWAATMLFVSLAWVFFRITDLSTAGSVVLRLFGAGGSSGIAWFAISALVLAPVVYVADVLAASGRLRTPQARVLTFRGAFLATSLAIAFALFWPTETTPFIYFQF